MLHLGLTDHYFNTLCMRLDNVVGVSVMIIKIKRTRPRKSFNEELFHRDLANING